MQSSGVALATLAALGGVVPLHANVSHAIQCTVPTLTFAVARSEALKLCAPTSPATTRMVADVDVLNSAAWLTGAANANSSSSASARRGAVPGRHRPRAQAALGMPPACVATRGSSSPPRWRPHAQA